MSLDDSVKIELMTRTNLGAADITERVGYSHLSLEVESKTKVDELTEIFRTTGKRDTELAERLGTTQRYIWEIEAGKPSIFMARLFAMMREVDVELSATIRSPEKHG